MNKEITYSSQFVVVSDADQAMIVAQARAAVDKKLQGAEIIKTIVVPKKLVNFVVKK